LSAAKASATEICMIYDFDDVLVEYLVSREGLRELVGTRIYPPQSISQTPAF